MWDVERVETPSELAKALLTIPRDLLLRGARRWERVAGTRIGTTRQAAVAEQVARWVFDPGLLERLIEKELGPGERTLVDLAARPWPSLSVLLVGAAGEGHGDLIDAVPSCAALGLLVPVAEDTYMRDLWLGEEIRHPDRADVLMVPATVADRPAERAPVEVRVREAAGEVIMAIPLERAFAAAASTAVAVMASPLALTNAGGIARRTAKRIVRATGADEDLPLGFRLAMLTELGLLLPAERGEKQTLALNAALLERMMRDDELLGSALTRLVAGFLGDWSLTTGSTPGESATGFTGHLFDRYGRYELRMYRRLFSHALGSLPDSSGWLPLDGLAAQIAARAPSWLLAQDRHWWGYSRRGTERWEVRKADRKHLEALAVLFLGTTAVRLGILELGKREDTAFETGSFPYFPASQSPSYETMSPQDEEILRTARGLLVRLAPLPAGLFEMPSDVETAPPSAAPMLRSDLELHVPRAGLRYPDAIVAAVLGDPLPYAPGDQVLRSKISAASMARARSMGVSVERIEELLGTCRPAPAEAARRRVLEWAERSASAVLHTGWYLAEWSTSQRRDRAVEHVPSMVPVGSRWALLPPSLDIYAETYSLPAPMVSLNADGTLGVKGIPEVARRAIATVARIGSGSTAALDREAIRALGLKEGQLRDSLKPWMELDPVLQESLEAVIAQVSGATRPAPWARALVVSMPSAQVTRRVAAALAEQGVVSIAAGERMLVLPEGEGKALRSAAKANGLKPVRRELADLAEPVAGPKPSGGGLRLSLPDGTVLESLGTRALRRRLEAAQAANRPVILLARFGQQFRPHRVLVDHVGTFDGLLHVFVQHLDTTGRPGRNAVALREIAAIGYPG